MENTKISLNQIGVLINNFLKDKKYAEHFVIYDLDGDLYTQLENMSSKQYAYLKHLVVDNKWFTVKDILDKFLKHK